MTTGMPELGSKISLISKADIRYEGRLFTVDPQECTIALASVRSFGTEDRETQYPVPAQSQIYDYILFRGSDIKDIRVVNNVAHPQPLNDPAIMQLSVPPTLGAQQFQNHPVLGHMGAPMGQFGQYGMGMGVGPAAAAAAAGLAIQAVGPPRPSKPTSVLDLIGGGTRSTTPASLASRKSPTNDQGVQAGGSREAAGGSAGKKPVKPIQPPGGQRGGQRPKSRERKDSGRADGGQDRPQQPQTANRQQNRSQQGSYHGGYQGGQHQQQVQRQHQGGWRQPPPPVAGPSGGGGGGGRPRGRPRGGGFRGPQGQPQPSASKKNQLKFDKDYDFEQANKEYEELKTKFSKVKVDEAKPEVNGDADKKDDSGNETGAGETEQDEDHEVYYDKTKSFFDKISCEAVERAKGKSQRTDWRTERKLNSETFGVAATRRGNYRGRGGFRGGYRGGFRGGYRQQRRDSNQGGNQQQQQQQQNQQGRSSQQQPQVQNLNQPQAPQDDTEKDGRSIEVWTSTVGNAYERQAKPLTADDDAKSEPEGGLLQAGSEGALTVIEEAVVKTIEVPVELQ